MYGQPQQPQAFLTKYPTMSLSQGCLLNDGSLDPNHWTLCLVYTHTDIYIYTHIYIHCVKLCREGEIERERADVTDGGTSFNIPFFEGTEGEQWAQAGLRCHHQTGLAKKAPTSNRSPVDRCSEYTIFTHTIRSYIQSCV
jgi:hypothetical protein